MFKAILISLFALRISESLILHEKCTFRNLYKPVDERYVVYEALSHLFDQRFNDVLKLASKSSPYLVDPAKHFKKQIKEKYINEGSELSTLEHLDLLLKEFEYIKISDFREQKFKFDNKRQ